MPLIRNEPEEKYDWTRFWVRFACGAIPGALLGFGFWVQMCRPDHMLRYNAYWPRQLTKALGLESTIDSGFAGLMVVLTFAVLAGTGLAVWRHISTR